MPFDDAKFADVATALVAAHWREIQEAMERERNLRNLLETARADLARSREDAAHERTMAAAENASLSTQLTETNAKLTRALKKIHSLLSAPSNASGAETSLDDGDTVAALFSKNEALRNHLAETERKRAIETASFAATIAGLERENQILADRLSYTEKRWIDDAIAVAKLGQGASTDALNAQGSKRIVLSENKSPKQMSPQTGNKGEFNTPNLSRSSALVQVQGLSGNAQLDSAGNSAKRTFDVDETQTPSQIEASKKAKVSELQLLQHHTDVDDKSQSKSGEPDENYVASKDSVRVSESEGNNFDSSLSPPPILLTKGTKSNSTTPVNSAVSRQITGGATRSAPSMGPRKFQEVVRDKAERRKLHGTSCACCNDFFEAVGPVAPILELGQTAIEGARNQHLQKVSRHRVRFEAPETPVGFWDVGFPTTQEVAENNRANANPNPSTSRRKK
ncbi:hypothetical protein HDU82_007915 [Entophlyctis luteolus]|nr:hypothetical protein HDU82_007915 [Entophlyctis luteolus]